MQLLHYCALLMRCEYTGLSQRCHGCHWDTQATCAVHRLWRVGRLEKPMFANGHVGRAGVAVVAGRFVLLALFVHVA